MRCGAHWQPSWAASAAAGAAGAFSGETAAQYILNNYYGGKTDNLSEQERQQVSMLATIAAGIAGGLSGNSTEAAGAGAAAGKNVVENNALAVVAAEAAANTAAAMAGAAGNGGKGSANGDDWDAGGGCEGTREQCALRDGTRDGTRGPGHVMNGDGSEENSQPNIGKDLTDNEKAELGGSGSGTPGGWEPGDEENARSNEAHNAVNGKNLNAELTGKEIANGPAFDKHVIMQNEFADLGIKTKEQFARHIESVVKNPASSKELSGGRSAYWDQSSGTVVIRNPKPGDGGTAFRPVNGRAYFDNLR